MIVDIVLDSRETIPSDENVHRLQFLPKYIPVRLDQMKTPHLPVLQDQLIPIEPMTVSPFLDVPRYLSTDPIPAYGPGFTNYRLQGQTILQCAHNRRYRLAPERNTITLQSIRGVITIAR